MDNAKEVTISFKIDKTLAAELDNVANRSAFIRQAVQQALYEHCPFCSGSGVLLRSAWQHWQQFLKEHELVHCPDCAAVYPICSHHAQVDQKGHQHIHEE